MSATPEQREAWQAMTSHAKREVGGQLQVGRYQIHTDSIVWYDFPLSRPPTIASTEPAGVVAVPVPLPAEIAAHAYAHGLRIQTDAVAQDKPIKKRAKRKAKA